MLRHSTRLLGNRFLVATLNSGKPFAATATGGKEMMSQEEMEAQIKATDKLFAPPKFKPPIRLYDVPGRYASGFWSSVAGQGKLDKVERELLDIKEGFAKHPEVLPYLSNPTILRKKRIENVRKMFTEFGYDPIVCNLFVIMAEDGRMSIAPKVIDAYHKIMMAQRKESIVTVTTAEALTAEEQKQLMTSLKPKIGMDRKITLSLVVDPEIIGGLIVEWDDAYRVDLSVATSIKRLESELKETI